MKRDQLIEEPLAGTQQPMPVMIEERLTDEQFMGWLASPNLLDMQYMKFEYRPRREGFNMPIEKPRKLRLRKDARRDWTIFNSAKYGIAVHTDGNVVARQISECSITIRIDQTGVMQWNLHEPGPDFLASQVLKSIVESIADEIQAWVDRAEGRQMPPGIKPLLMRLKEAGEWRRKVCGRSKSHTILFKCGLFNPLFPGYCSQAEQERSKALIERYLRLPYKEIAFRLCWPGAELK